MFEASFGQTSGRYWLVQEPRQQQKSIAICGYKHRHICIYTSKCVCLLREDVQGSAQRMGSVSFQSTCASFHLTNQQEYKGQLKTARHCSAVPSSVSLWWPKTLTWFWCRAPGEESDQRQSLGSLASFSQQLKTQTQMINHHLYTQRILLGKTIKNH